MAQMFTQVTSARAITPLPDDTSLGAAHLIVADLQRSVEFYTDILGFTQAAGPATNGEASLTIGDDPTPVLRLSEIQGARRKPARSTGLYHVAIVTPSRLDLARSLLHLAESRYPLSGASDHLVSEALYLSDPDGNGLEIYRDRPRADWPRQDNLVRMDTLPLDLDALLDEAQADPRPWAGLAAGTRVGHVHLHVAHLDPAVAFYREIIGLDLMIQLGGSAAFMSAGGYHHHLGLNTWAGVGAPQPPDDAVGIRIWDIVLPSHNDVEAVAARLDAASVAYTREDNGAITAHDPSGNAVRVTSAS